MSLQPIVLWTPKATLTSDDACTTILQYELASPPSATQAPYYRRPPPTGTGSTALSYVPPLVYFCLKSLLDYPDQIHLLGPARLRYERPTDGHDFDILQALIPTYRPFSPHHANFDLCLVDPRLWAVLVQIYEDLPTFFREYTLPLSDIYLPLLQAIPSTNDFSLVTVLSLTKCRELTDDTVLELRHLHTLAALDASVTALGTWGVQRLAKSLSWTDGDDEQRPERHGPWGLRVLYLKDCVNIDDKVLDCLPRFPLLSVVDLRGTVCMPWMHRTLAFSPSSDKNLFKSDALSEVLGHLATLSKTPRTLFSHPAPYVLKVDTLYHRVDPTPPYRIHNNLWGGEGPDTRPPQQSLVQVARHGRMDVFLPYKSPLPRYESPPYEGSTNEISYPSGNPDEHCPEEDEYDVEDEYDPEDENNDMGRFGEEDNHGTDGPAWNGPSAPYDSLGDSASVPLRRGRQRSASPNFEPHTWMNEVADEELTLYKKQRLVDKFYCQSGPRPATSLSNIAAGIGADSARSTSTSQGLPDPLMLFRTPLPWSSLPSFPPAKKSSSAATASSAVASARTPSSAPSGSPHKRRRVEDVAPADQARKRMHALSSIQTMFGMVQKRAADSQAKAAHASQPEEQNDVSSSSGMQTKRNPFARVPGTQSRKAPRLHMQRAKSPVPKAVDKWKAPSPSKSRIFLRSLGPRINVRETAKATDLKAVAPEKCDRAIDVTPSISKGPPPRVPPSELSDRPASLYASGKKLKPISTLTVPDWPGNPTLKPLSSHKPQPALMLAKTKKQTTLPRMSREASPSKPKPPPPLSNSDSVPAKNDQVGRRISAPVPITNRPHVLDPEKGAATRKNAPTKSVVNISTPKVKRKSSGGGKGFDWKGWSAGS